MLKRLMMLSAAAIVACAGTANAAIYTDAQNENFDGNAHMDITQVEVTNTLTDITFKVSVRAESIIAPADWGKYLVGIDTNSATGDFADPVGNPWGRNIRMADGTDAFIGSWVDGGGGFQPWTFAGAAWTQNGQGSVVIDGNMTTITTSLASLGLSPGQTISFDVYSSGGGGGDSANDAAANMQQTVNDWQVPYTTAAGTGLQYTLVVPEPASLALVGLGGLALLARRRA